MTTPTAGISRSLKFAPSAPSLGSGSSWPLPLFMSPLKGSRLSPLVNAARLTRIGFAAIALSHWLRLAESGLREPMATHSSRPFHPQLRS